MSSLAYKPTRKSRLSKTLGSQWQLMLMSVPMLLYVLLFNYAPMWGWLEAFKDYSSKSALATGNAPWIGLGTFVGAIINFLVIALVLFSVIKAMNKAKELADRALKKKQEEEAAAEPPKPTTEELLGEILEELKKKNGAA